MVCRVALEWLVSGGESNPQEGDGSRVSRKELFISYSHKDRAFLEQFWTHLRPLEEDYGLQRWDDSRMRPGDIWLKEIEQALKRAQVALLLVSPDFLASEFIRRKELPALFEAAEKDGLTILWLPIRPCSWKRHRQIEQYQSVGSLDPTLAEMDEVKRDREMVKITDRIHQLFERIQKERPSSQPVVEGSLYLEFRRQEEEYDKFQAEENSRSDCSEVGSESRVELERLQAEIERLKREKNGLQSSSPPLQRQTTYVTSTSNSPPLIQISVTRGWIVRENQGWLNFKKHQWRKMEEDITVSGYREELAGGIAITMIQIPEGEFIMGSPKSEVDRHSEEQRQVTLRSFFLGQTQVTQNQWKMVASFPKLEIDLNPAPSRFKGGNRPVESVSWEEVSEFCRRLSARTYRHYTIPSEAQWEYACRAGTSTPFAFGETLSTELVNYDPYDNYASGPSGSSLNQTAEVASFPANRWGLHDMHGNVYELCQDAYPWNGNHEKWSENVSTSIAAGGGWSRLRGGSFNSYARECRSAASIGNRDRNRPQKEKNLFMATGFRLCVPSFG